MADEILKLNTGDTIQVQLFADRNETRYIVKVIGYQPGVSLLINTPRANGNTLLMRDGQLLTIRLLTGSTVYGFESRVMRVCTSPFPYIHVAFPKEFASTVVRKAQRASANVIASVENPDRGSKEPQPAVIGDLSTAGASLMASTPMGEVGDCIMIRTKLVIGGIEKYLSLAAIIRAVRQREDEGTGVRYRHGVEFQMLGPEEQLVLHGFVYEQIASGKAV